MIEAKLFNTATKKLELVPNQKGKVTIYSCGPTVYSRSTLGNLRTAVGYDWVARGLKLLGYQVERAQNYTDVGHLTSDADLGEDKLAKQAERERKTAWQIASINIKQFEEDTESLHILPPDHLIKATDEIEAMIDLIKKLEEKGYTYVTPDGLYFDTSRYAHYGQLADLDIEGLKEGARVEKNPAKKHPTDFALWKFTPKSQIRDMEWDSPWGRGFPGWHIECSAMAIKLYGPTIDIHLGGIDLLPVHHQNEVAQSESATGQVFSKMWVHFSHLLVDGRRMGKSLGNGYTLADVQEKGFSPLDFRYLTALTHYRQKLNFTWEALGAARTARERLQSKLMDDISIKADEEIIKAVKERVADDLDIPGALALVWQYAGSESDPQKVSATIRYLNENLFDCLKESSALKIPSKIEQLVRERELARKSGDYKRADTLREQIDQRGYSVTDTAEGSLLTKNG